MQKLPSSFKRLLFLSMGFALLGFSTQAIAQIPEGEELPYNDAEIIWGFPVSEGIADNQAALLESNQPDILEKYSKIKIINFPNNNLENEVRPVVGVVMNDGVGMDAVQANVNGHVVGYVANVNHPKVGYKVADEFEVKIEKIDACQEFIDPSKFIKEYQAKNCPPAEEDPADEPDNQAQATSTPVEGTATNTVGSDMTDPSDPANEAAEELTDEFDADSIISQGGGCAFSPAPLSTSFSSFWMLTPLILIFLRLIRK